MNSPPALLFGTAGIPASTEKPNTANGIKQVKALGLGCMELEFVHSIFLSRQTAPPVAETAKQENIFLTVHSPYYINLNAQTAPILHASKQRILDSARIGLLAGAWSVTFHPGFYMKQDSEAVYQKIKQEVKEIVSTLKKENNPVWIRPETTGKATQFGDLKEILKLSSEVEQVMPCIDFSHLHARTNALNTKPEFHEMLALVEKTLGKTGLHNMHIHVSGINYSKKGERNHLDLKDSDMNYKDLMKVFKEFKIKGCIISESPDIEGDALLMKSYYEKI